MCWVTLEAGTGPQSINPTEVILAARVTLAWLRTEETRGFSTRPESKDMQS